ncbi:MAG: 23S rRNA (guanosine(2251)-2'-O)-methyltransferase RlmB [Bacillota bacterium]
MSNQAHNDRMEGLKGAKGELIAGRQAVLEALRSGKPMLIKMADGIKGPIISEIKLLARHKKIPVEYLSSVDFQDEAGKISGNQGVAALVAPFQYNSLSELITFSRSINEDPLLIMLDHVEDPHNLGAVMRTADAAGVHGLILPNKRAAGVTASVRKVAAGAAERMPVALVGNLIQAIEVLKKEGFWLYGAEADGEDAFYRVDYRCPLVLVIGSEGKGLSRLVRQNCDLIISIPMLGAKAGSLNVSAAAAVLIYAAQGQRMGWSN